MGDSYRPMRRDRDPPPAKPLAERMTFGNGNGDTYRPGQSNFTFESNHPAPRFPPSGPSNAGSRPPKPNRRPGRRDQRGGPSHRGRNNANGRGRGGFRKEMAHERALLQHQDDGRTEQTYGVSDGFSRFMNIDDMSDDEEAAMDESDNSSGDDNAANDQSDNPKVARTRAPQADGDAVPKWSNPDPYTSLPPPSETTGVKRDVVQLIRKAKNQIAEEKADSKNAVAANDDFISFGNDLEDDEDEDEEDDESSHGQANGRASPRPIQGSMNDVGFNRRGTYDSYEPPPPPPDAYDSYAPPPPPPPPQNTYDSYVPAPPGKGKKRKGNGGVIGIVPDWQPTPRGSSTPWATGHQYEHLVKMAERWLHNEILDFYDWVAPQKFEHDARHNLVKRIGDALSTQRWFPHDTGRILCFGSYPVSLYLPTADMDLVYASDRFYNGGPPVFEPSQDRAAFKKALYKASNRLSRVGIAKNPIPIVNARVPIIKFKDVITGLDVDISFENLSGVQAQATFDKWKRDYPDMVYLVALVKQLLVMRGLNEVHTGGLGGYSIICLIVSYIQHSKKADNLGECFIGFLKYYGKEFNLATQRIQMNPPAIVKKGDYGIDGRAEQPAGLSIQDPNKLDNNISGGSKKAPDVFAVFSAAYDTLYDRMKASKAGQDVGVSLLRYILGGNYDSYIQQRNRLRNLNPEDLADVDERIKYAQMAGDGWAQELNWMRQVQTNRTRTVLFS